MGILKPLRGHCLIELDAAMNAVESGIIIPMTSQRARGFSGVCIDVGNREDMHLCAELIGKRVMLETWAGRIVPYNGKDYFVCKVENVVAIVDGFNKIKIEAGSEYGVPRCRFCKSPNGQGNIILDGEGYCPICKRNNAGSSERPEVRVSDDEIERMGGPKPMLKSTKITVVRP